LNWILKNKLIIQHPSPKLENGLQYIGFERHFIPTIYGINEHLWALGSFLKIGFA
jgi:hypothetical protein